MMITDADFVTVEQAIELVEVQATLRAKLHGGYPTIVDSSSIDGYTIRASISCNGEPDLDVFANVDLQEWLCEIVQCVVECVMSHVASGENPLGDDSDDDLQACCAAVAALTYENEVSEKQWEALLEFAAERDIEPVTVDEAKPLEAGE